MPKEIQQRRYQARAQECFPEWMSSPDPLATIILPTGTGKTITAALCLSQVPDKKILWAAHREELIDQAYEALGFVMPNRHISIEMADRRADPGADIVVGSVQTLARQRKNLEGFTPDIIVIDEYHHYAESNVQYDGLLKRWQAKIMGLTATPWRFSGENLPLGRTLIQMDIGTAVEKQYLVPPVAQTLLTDVSLAEVKTRMGDFAIKDLSKAVNVDSRNRMIARRIIEMVRAGRQGILFAVDVDHSKAMYELLKKEVRAAEVYGETPTEMRRDLMKKIRNREIDVLCNNLVATEGFDVPHLSFICIARPTKSLGLFIQMAGRGLRTSDGKNDCVIIDVHDKIKIKQSRVTFSDMAVAGDLYGERKRAMDVLKREVPVEPLSKKLKNFPIFINKEKLDRWQVDEDSFTVSSWSIAQDQWIVTWTEEVKEPRVVSKQIFIPWDEIPPPSVRIAGRAVQHEKHGKGAVVSLDATAKKAKCQFGSSNYIFDIADLRIQKFVNEFSATEVDVRKVDKVFYICMPDVTGNGRIISFTKDGRDLILKDDQYLPKSEADAYLLAQASKDGVLPLVRTNAKWKMGPASEKQKQYVQKMMDDDRIGFDLDLDTLTKGDASAIIDQSRWQQLIHAKFGTNIKEALLGYDVSIHDV